MHGHRRDRGSKNIDLPGVVRLPIGEDDLCKGPDCKNKPIAKGLCSAHRRQYKKDGELRPLVDRQHYKKWSYGERRPNKDGYILVYKPDHPNAKGSGHVLEHRMVMSDILDRPLRHDENVHHKNGFRDDNRLVKGHEIECPDGCCNLQLWSKFQPPGQRVCDKIAWAKKVLETYEPEALSNYEPKVVVGERNS